MISNISDNLKHSLFGIWHSRNILLWNYDEIMIKWYDWIWNLCSFDLRSPSSDGQHWKDHNTLGKLTFIGILDIFAKLSVELSIPTFYLVKSYLCWSLVTKLRFLNIQFCCEKRIFYNSNCIDIKQNIGSLIPTASQHWSKIHLSNL